MINNKNLKFLVLLFILLALLLVVTSCKAKITGHQILGVWEHNGSKIEFSDDGYFKKGNEKYEFSVTEKQVTIDNNGEAMILDYALNSNGTLTMNGLIYYPVSK